MTNQQPLTAERIASQIITDVRGWCYYDNYNDDAESSLRFNTNAEAIKNIKAYAAQQKAAIIADVKLLRALATGARIPHHIMCDVVQPTKDPWICNCGAEERQKRLDEALAATDKPEHKEGV